MECWRWLRPDACRVASRGLSVEPHYGGPLVSSLELTSGPLYLDVNSSVGLDSGAEARRHRAKGLGPDNTATWADRLSGGVALAYHDVGKDLALAHSALQREAANIEGEFLDISDDARAGDIEKAYELFSYAIGDGVRLKGQITERYAGLVQCHDA